MWSWQGPGGCRRRHSGASSWSCTLPPVLWSDLEVCPVLRCWECHPSWVPVHSLEGSELAGSFIQPVLGSFLSLCLLVHTCIALHQRLTVLVSSEQEGTWLKPSKTMPSCNTGAGNVNLFLRNCSTWGHIWSTYCWRERIFPLWKNFGWSWESFGFSLVLFLEGDRPVCVLQCI
jgi:hypothetical protein